MTFEGGVRDSWRQDRLVNRGLSGGHCVRCVEDQIMFSGSVYAALKLFFTSQIPETDDNKDA